MTEVQAIDWRKAKNQRPIRAALKDSRRIIHELCESGTLDAMGCKVLTGLLHTAQFTHANLISSSARGAIAFSAWCARCLLEAEMWMEYVTLSRSNLERFHNDWVNDAAELLDCSASAGEMNPQQLADLSTLFGGDLVDSAAESKAKAQAMLAESRKSAQLEDEDYLRLSAIAKEMGRGQWFSKYNKMLSKYVHATAFSVLSFPTERARMNTSGMMLYEGTQSCLRLLYALNEFLKRRNLPQVF